VEYRILPTTLSKFRNCRSRPFYSILAHENQFSVFLNEKRAFFIGFFGLRQEAPNLCFSGNSCAGDFETEGGSGGNAPQEQEDYSDKEDIQADTGKQRKPCDCFQNVGCNSVTAGKGLGFSG
jgi:hypothetical protein